MSWIVMMENSDGSAQFRIKDVRDGIVISIYAGATAKEAIRTKATYDARRDLERDGYEDIYQDKIDQLKDS